MLYTSIYSCGSYIFNRFILPSRAMEKPGTWCPQQVASFPWRAPELECPFGVGFMMFVHGDIKFVCIYIYISTYVYIYIILTYSNDQNNR